jgi:hypothetical protein
MFGTICRKEQQFSSGRLLLALPIKKQLSQFFAEWGSAWFPSIDHLLSRA